MDLPVRSVDRCQGNQTLENAIHHESEWVRLREDTSAIFSQNFIVALPAHFQFLVMRDNVEPSPTGHLGKFIHHVRTSAQVRAICAWRVSHLDCFCIVDVKTPDNTPDYHKVDRFRIPYQTEHKWLPFRPVKAPVSVPIGVEPRGRACKES